jgi:hypothetical protein
VSKFPRQIGADDLGQKRIENGTRRPNVWALRDTARWKNVDERVIAQFYHKPEVPLPISEADRRNLAQGVEAALRRANPETESRT